MTKKRKFKRIVEYKWNDWDKDSYKNIILFGAIMSLTIGSFIEYVIYDLHNEYKAVALVAFIIYTIFYSIIFYLNIINVYYEEIK